MNNLLSSINVTSLLIVLAIVAILAIVFGALIVLVSKLCAVKEDEKAKAISEKLAGANCGGCGYAGCADFAKALAEGKANINDCGATSNESKQDIATILEIPFSATAETFAVVKCRGGENCKDKFNYVGNDGCLAHTVFSGGEKLCQSGCIGAGDCVKACPEKSISVSHGFSQTDKDLCISCGACVKACPKNLIELIPKTATVYVACSSKCKGKDVMNACSKGCIGCGLCAKNCPNGAIIMINNLPVIDYNKCSGCKICVSKCPRKCIVEVE
jgi:Na+-translocating ferredoxin:NAD+ oxidoreductase RNF subunit RnfB